MLTSPFFSLPKVVVDRISKTMRERCAREKKLSVSLLPRNLQKK
jgi:hypothetical protein